MKRTYAVTWYELKKYFYDKGLREGVTCEFGGPGFNIFIDNGEVLKNNCLRFYDDRGAEFFEGPDSILGVSKERVTRIEEIGKERNKIIYLPSQKAK